MLGISLFFLFFYPNLEWYMGLSGLLHGLFVIGAIGEIRKGNMFYLLGLLAITTKLVIEYFAGPSDFTNQFINALVITNAHFSGAITGGIAASIIICLNEIFPIRLLKITQKNWSKFKKHYSNLSR
jgi:rhomboid family GlyGly-CTERM serine protease